MHPFAVRAVATGLTLAGLVLLGLYLGVNRPAGTFGMRTEPISGGPAARVLSVDLAGGPAAAAGVMPGDVLRDAPGENAGLLLLANVPLIAAGDRIAFVIVHAEQIRTVTLQAVPDRGWVRYEAVLFTLLGLPLLGLGWFIVWYQPERHDTRLLGATVLFLGIFTAFPDRVGAPLVRFAAYELVASVAIIVAIYLTVAFFAGFPEGSGLRASRIRRTVLAIAGAASIIDTTAMVFDYLAPAVWGRIAWLDALVLSTVVPPLCGLIACIDAYRHADAAARTRLRWLATNFGVGYSGLLVLPLLTLALGSKFTVVVQAACEATLFPFAIGLTYGVLRRRVVDVAVVLNRAIVFSIVSAIVVALFVSVEVLVGTFLVNASRATSFVVQIVVAVVIGLSLRPLHDRVDRVIDRAFFAKRYEAERALRRLANEVHFIRDPARLIERVLADISAHADVDSVAVYYRDDPRADFALLGALGDAVAVADADDDALVRLVVEEQPLDLHRIRTALPGELAVPLAIRKVLVGVLVLGHKRSGEAFASDEIETYRFLGAHLATAVALGRPLAADSGAPALRELIDELQLQRAEIRRLSEALDAERRLGVENL